jgi:hypothetical protein
MQQQAVEVFDKILDQRIAKQVFKIYGKLSNSELSLKKWYSREDSNPRQTV